MENVEKYVERYEAYFVWIGQLASSCGQRRRHQVETSADEFRAVQYPRFQPITYLQANPSSSARLAGKEWREGQTDIAYRACLCAEVLMMHKNPLGTSMSSAKCGQARTDGDRRC